jgi:hypothetical protein
MAFIRTFEKRLRVGIDLLFLLLFRAETFIPKSDLRYERLVEVPKAFPECVWSTVARPARAAVRRRKLITGLHTHKPVIALGSQECPSPRA